MPQSKSPSAEPTRKTVPPSQFFDRVGVWFSRATVRFGLRRMALCPTCGHAVTSTLRYRRARVCDHCGYNFPMSARVRIDYLVDPHSFSDFAIVRKRRADFRRIYPMQQIATPRDAVVTGSARVAEQPVVIVAFDFGFRGGTMSVAVGERITRAFEYAAQHNLPVIAIVATGGVRIQEGIPALLQMAKTTQAVQEFQRAGRSFIALSGCACAPATGSGMIRSMIPRRTKSAARFSNRSAASVACNASPNKMADAPSGEITEKVAFSSMRMRSVTASASAPPLVPSPMTMDTVGAWACMSAARQFAIAPAMPRRSES